MAADTPLVIVTRRLTDSVETRMRESVNVRLNTADGPFSKDDLIAAIKEAGILVPTVTDRVDADVIAAAGPGLRLIANFGVGVNHIDLAACRAKGIAVTNTPGVLTDDTADITIALILDCMRRVNEGERQLRAGAWPGWAPTNLLGRRLKGKRLGIIGMGRIGQAVAGRAAAFGMDVHYHNRRPIKSGEAPDLDATYWPDLDAMLAEMDIVSVNCPLTPETHHLLNVARLDRLKRGAYVVNTARGEIIDEDALAERLADGRLAGAGLDVYTGEPEVNPKLKALENVVLAPHLGSATEETRTAMGEKVMANIEAFLAGRELPDKVV